MSCLSLLLFLVTGSRFNKIDVIKFLHAMVIINTDETSLGQR